MNSTFDRSYIKDVLPKRLDNYMKEFEADVSLNETNIHDKTLLRASLAAKWCRYEYEEKKAKEIMEEKMEKLKEKAQEELFKQQNDAIVNRTVPEMAVKLKVNQIIGKSPAYNKIKDELKYQDDVLRFIAEAKQIISQFGFDIKNSIEILKLENI